MRACVRACVCVRMLCVCARVRVRVRVCVSTNILPTSFKPPFLPCIFHTLDHPISHGIKQVQSASNLRP